MAELAEGTLLIVGLGTIGTEVARLARAFGMRVIGVNRTGRTDSPYIDEARPPRFLPVAHGVVLTLPLTGETRGMIDAAAISPMRAAAVLVDVGRSGVADKPALVRALEQGRLAGAPSTSSPPSRSLPTVPYGTCPMCSSAHTAGLSLRENERIVALFMENLRHYLAGDELASCVHPILLY